MDTSTRVDEAPPDQGVPGNHSLGKGRNRCRALTVNA